MLLLDCLLLTLIVGILRIIVTGRQENKKIIGGKIMRVVLIIGLSFIAKSINPELWNSVGYGFAEYVMLSAIIWGFALDTMEVIVNK